MKTIDRIFTRFTNKRVSLWKTAVNMAVIHFGTITIDKYGCYGELAIHLQCSWRIRNAKRVITGNMDQYQPADSLSDKQFTKWYASGKWTNNLMAEMIRKSLHVSYGPLKSNSTSPQNPLVVNADFKNIGDIVINFSNGLIFETFNNSTHGEVIRIIDLISSKHYVYER